MSATKPVPTQYSLVASPTPVERGGVLEFWVDGPDPTKVLTGVRLALLDSSGKQTYELYASVVNTFADPPYRRADQLCGDCAYSLAGLPGNRHAYVKIPTELSPGKASLRTGATLQAENDDGSGAKELVLTASIEIA